jgi:hypothetical protein
VTYILLFLASALSWTISTLSGGGGSVLFVALVSGLSRAQAVAPVVTIASLMVSPARMALSWRLINWRLVCWYLPGAVSGGVLGGWAFTWLDRKWIGLIIALFLISTAWQYRFGKRERSFQMRLAGFVPVSFFVALVSGIVGASGLLANPFYLNYGLVKERMIATRAVNSLVIQLSKIGTYFTLGALNADILLEGLAAGLGAVLAIWMATPWLNRLREDHFRKFAIIVMVISGFVLLWQQRSLVL